MKVEVRQAAVLNGRGVGAFYRARGGEMRRWGRRNGGGRWAASMDSITGGDETQGAIARERRRLGAWKMRWRRCGSGVDAAGGAWHNGSDDLDQWRWMFDPRWKEGVSGPSWPGKAWQAKTLGGPA
jgi:hypothetical protein